MFRGTSWKLVRNCLREHRRLFFFVCLSFSFRKKKAQKNSKQCNDYSKNRLILCLLRYFRLKKNPKTKGEVFCYQIILSKY